jgi:CheY-like chemotaxis protein/Flp pilus assembly protein TadD
VAETILVVDDDRHFSQILSRAFGQAGWRVETAHDGEKALARMRELEPTLVTLDVMLPRMDGFTVLEVLRRDVALRDTPVLLISGCTLTAEYEERARRLGCAEVLKKPVPLDQMLTLVAKHARGARAKPAKAAAAKSVPLGGAFDEIPFPALLHHLHGLRASGVLALESGKKRKQLQLRDGIPVALRSNMVNETLGSLLVASGKITPDVLHDSLLRVKRGEGQLGNILIAMHMLDEADLATALHRQAEEKLLEIFEWEFGSSRFHPATRIKGGANALGLKRSPASLVLEGVRTRMPIAAIDHYLAERADRLVAPSASPFYQFQDVDLAPSERSLLEKLDGKASLATLARGGETSRRTLYALVVLELVDLLTGPRLSRREDTFSPRPARPVRAPEANEESVRAELTTLAERMRGQDAFGVLGVGRGATDEEIRNAYALLAKRTHPDRFSASSAALRRVAEEVFAMVSSAYEAIADGPARLAYGRSLADRRELDKEIDEGQRAVRAELAFQKGEAALRSRRPDLALDHFRSAVDLYPDEGEYHAALGWALHLTKPGDEGTLKRALIHVLRARKLAPDRAKPYLYLGRLYLAGGRQDVAEKMLAQCIQIDPDCVDALRELRLMNMRREKSKGLVRRILRR